jgi:hypothetical protein
VNLLFQLKIRKKTFLNLIDRRSQMIVKINQSYKMMKLEKTQKNQMYGDKQDTVRRWMKEEIMMI